MGSGQVLIVRTTGVFDLIPPLGALYVGAAIRSAESLRGLSVRILDYYYERLGEDGFSRLVGELSPDFVLFSSLDSEYPVFKRLCSLARQAAPDATLVSGGILSTNYHQEIVRRGLVDVAVRNEGEITAVELLTALRSGQPLSGVAGITYREDGQVVSTPPRPPIQDLDSLPPPAWDLIDLRGYSRVPNWNGELFAKPYAPVMTSRGCVFDCIYCHNLFGRRIRPRSVGNVLAEIEELYHRYGIREIHFIDDFFNYDLKRVQEICQGLVERRLKVRISFPNGLRVDRMDHQTLDWLKRAGTYKINYAVETASPRVQRAIRKRVDLDKARYWIEETSRRGIITLGLFMFGFPDETVEEMEKTIDFAVSSQLDTAKFFKVTVFRNTGLEELAAGPAPSTLDDLEQRSGDVFYDPSLNYSDIPTEALNRILVRAHQRFYSQPGRILRILLKYRGLRALKRLYEIRRFVTTMQRDSQTAVTH